MKPPRRNIFLHSLCFTAAVGIHAVVLALPTDRQQEVHIQCEEGAKIDRPSGRAVGQGNCIFEQGSLRITADTLTVERSGDTSTYTAEGSPATFQQLPEPDAELVRARGNRIVYQEQSGKVIFIGNASINQGGRLTTAERLEYDSTQESMLMEGPIEMVFPPAQSSDTDTD